MVYLGLIMGPPIPRGPFNPPIFPMFLRSYCGPGRRVECRRSWEVMVIPWVFLRKSSCYHWYRTWMETPGIPVGTIQKKTSSRLFIICMNVRGWWPLSVWFGDDFQDCWGIFVLNPDFLKQGGTIFCEVTVPWFLKNFASSTPPRIVLTFQKAHTFWKKIELPFSGTAVFFLKLTCAFVVQVMHENDDALSKC